ncbi:MAG TPA: hypothetical protein VGZ23_07410 [bacterium]|nr:hypothetical protein [bacterium]
MSHVSRDTSLAGAWSRAQFELSLKSISTFRFSTRVVEHCRVRARATGRLPHALMIEIVEEAILSASRAV